MGGLSTHALDLVHGGPAAGLQIDFFIQQDGRYVLHKTHITNAEGRTDALFLSADKMQAGRYQFLFHLGAYFARSALTQQRTPIFDKVPVRFAITDTSSHYHVPILIAPWGYTVYRGS